MKEGFYEKIITEAVATAIENEADKTFLIESFNKTDGPGFISRYFQDILNRALNQIAEESDEKAKKKLIENVLRKNSSVSRQDYSNWGITKNVGVPKKM